MRLYVGNLKYSVTKTDLYDLFSRFGKVNFVDLAFGKDGRLKGFGFVEFAEEDDAKKAIEELNQSVFRGRRMFVEVATKQTSNR